KGAGGTGQMRREIFIAVLLLSSVAAARATVPVDCWKLRDQGHSGEAKSCFEGLTRSSDAYARAEGVWGLEEWARANEQFRLATQPADSPALYKVRWGALLYERFNNAESADLFREALAKDPNNAQAYLGLARVSADGFDGKAIEYLKKAIELDPKLAEPH